MSSVPSILRRSSLIGSPKVAAKNLHGEFLGSPSSQSKAVYFAPPENLSELLVRAANDKDNAELRIREELEGLLTHVKNQKGPGLIAWLTVLQDNVVALKPRLENFVLAILKIAWATQDEPVVQAFQSFLVNLVSAQTYYTKPVVRMLLSNMIGFRDRSEVTSRQNSEELALFNSVEGMVFVRSHQALQIILKAAPLAATQSVLQFSRECLPYAMTPDRCAHKNYLDNLLQMIGYLPEQRLTILKIIIERLVQLDAYLPKDYDEDELDDGVAPFLCSELSEDRKRLQQRIAAVNLDDGLLLLFQYVQQQSSDESCLKKVYFDVFSVFESHVLPAHATGHVQFLMFYLVSFRPFLAGHFLQSLWKNFCSVNMPSVLRQSSVFYIASLVARADYISVPVVLSCLDKLAEWIHSYIRHTDGHASGGDYMFTDVKSHGAFYAACQAAFYIFAFRHNELVHHPKLLNRIKSLQFHSIVTCHLNPLRVMSPSVVKIFSAVARNYQLAYCDTIIQRNSRINLPVVTGAPLSAGGLNNLLDAFFPFDPYRLKQSRVFIDTLYRKYQGTLGTDPGLEESEDSDDELHHRDDEHDVEMCEVILNSDL